MALFVTAGDKFSGKIPTDSAISALRCRLTFTRDEAFGLTLNHMPDAKIDALFAQSRDSGVPAPTVDTASKLALEAGLLAGGIGQGAWDRAREFAENPVKNTAIVGATTAATWAVGYAGARLMPGALGAAKFVLAGAALYEAGPGLLSSAQAALDTWANPSTYEENKALVAEKLGRPLFDLALYSAAGAGGLWKGAGQGKLANEIAGSLELQATRKSAATHVPVLSDLEGGTISQVRLGKNKQLAEIYSKGSPSIVQITHPSADGHPTFATGFVVDEGLIATNSHVLHAWKPPMVRLSSGETVEARLVARDKTADLALLKLPEGIKGGPPVKLGQSANMEAQNQVFMIGHPRDVSKPVVSTGVWNGKYGQKYIQTRSGILDPHPGNEQFVEKLIVDGHPALRELARPATAAPIVRRDVLSHTAPSQPGNSGSPIFDGAGKVVGVHSTGGQYKWGTTVEHLQTLLDVYKARPNANGWLKVVTHAQPRVERIGGAANWLERTVTTSVEVLDVKAIGK